MSESLGSAVLTLDVESGALDRGLSAAGVNIERFMGKGTLALGAVAAAAGAVGVALFKIGEDFDDAYDKIRVQTGATGKELRNLKADFRDVVKSVPTDFGSASEAVGGLNQRLDLQGRQLRERSKQILELSRITDTDLGTNIRTITRLFGDWSIATDKQGSTLDGLFRLSQKTGIEVAELSDLLVQFGSPLRTLGLDFEFSAAMLARFEKEGVNIQTLMSGLRIAVGRLSDPTDELKAQFKEFGITAKQPAEAVMQVMEAIEKTGSVTKGNTLAFEVFGQRAGSDMAAAIREGRFELDEYIKTMRGGEETIRQTGRQTMDLSEQWTLFKNRVLLLIEPIASKFFETIGHGAKLVNKFLRGDDFRAFGQDVEAALEKLRPLANFIGDRAKETFAGLGDVIQGALRILRGISRFVSGTFSGDWSKAWSGIKDVFFGTVEGIKGLLRTLYAPFRRVFGAIKDAAVGAFDKVLGALTTVLDGIAEGADLMSKLPGPIGDAWDKVQTGAEDASDAINRFREDLRGVNKLDGETKKSARGISNAIDAVRASLADANKDWKRHGDHVRDATDSVERGTKRMRDRAGANVREMGKDADRRSERMGRDMVGNIGRLVAKVTDGFGILTDNTNEQLKNLQVKKLIPKITRTVGKALSWMQRGGALGGSRTGDLNPAMLEDGEYVFNREAVKRVGRNVLDAINFGLAPRFATGGMVEPPGDPGTELVNRSIASQVGAFLRRFGIDLTAGYDPGGGHVSPGHNITGTALDIVPLLGRSWSTVDAAVKWAVQAGMKVLYDGSFGSIAYPNHGRGNHAHVEWPLGGVSGLAGMAGKIGRVLLKGITGPLQDTGQASLDKAWKASNSFIDKAFGLAGGAHGAIGSAGRYSADQIGALWRRVHGAFGNSRLMGAIGFAESSGDPHAHGPPDGRGLFQIEWPIWARVLSRLGNPYDPVDNTEMAGEVLKQQGLGAWVVYNTGAYRQFMQKGGLVEKAKRIMDRLRHTTRGIAGTDERIDIAERLASLDTSPSGSDLSAGEITQQLRLQGRLLDRLRNARKLAAKGLRIAGRGMDRDRKGRAGDRLRDLRATFRDTLQEMAGVTGAGGRIFDTKLEIAELKATTPGGGTSGGDPTTPGGMTIDQLLRFAEAVRYGAFDSQLPRFHMGGQFRAPTPGGEGLAMLRDKEYIVPPENVGPAAAPVVYADIYIGDEPIARRVRAEIREADRAAEGVYRAGVTP